MEVAEIIEEFENSELLPEAALRAAVAQREEVIPVFLEYFEDTVRGQSISIHKTGSLLLLIHLLAEFGESRAFRPLIELLRRDPKVVEEVLGDGITVTLSRVMISTYDGSLGILQEMILNSKVDEFVRYAGLEAMAYLTRVGKIDLEQAEAFLAECFGVFDLLEENYVWVGWQSTIALLGLESLIPKVKDAFQKGVIPPIHLSFEEFENDLKATLKNPDSMASFEGKRLEPFKSTIEEFSKWHGFSEEYWKEANEVEEETPWPPLRNEPDRNPHRHVGRNDPCPCGSGKKFKRCCLN